MYPGKGHLQDLRGAGRPTYLVARYRLRVWFFPSVLPIVLPIGSSHRFFPSVLPIVLPSRTDTGREMISAYQASRVIRDRGRRTSDDASQEVEVAIVAD